MKRLIAVVALFGVIAGCGPKIGALPTFPKEPVMVEVSKVPDPESVCKADEVPLVYFRPVAPDAAVLLVFCGKKDAKAADGLSTLFIRRYTAIIVPDKENPVQNMNGGLDFQHDTIATTNL